MHYKKLKNHPSNDSFLLVQSTLNIYSLAYHLNDVLSIYLKRENNKKIRPVNQVNFVVRWNKNTEILETLC